MSAIFLSYRRGDAQGTTGRIFDWLEKHYGADEVFMDADDIPLGVDFRRHIERHIGQAEVLLAVIGPKWNEVADNGKRKLSSRSDWVRIEVQLALESGVAVVPLFVDGANLPIPGRLPNKLKDLAFHQAEHIDSGRDFRSHIVRLVSRLDALIERRHADRLKVLKAGIAAAAPPVAAAPTIIMPSPPTTTRATGTPASPVVPSAQTSARPSAVLTKPLKPGSDEKSRSGAAQVAEDLANRLAQLAPIGRRKD